MTKPIDKHLTELSEHIADKAMQKDTSFAESLDAFKSLTAYYGLLLKTRTPTEDDESPNFANFGKALDEAQEEHPNGGTGSKVSGRRRQS